MQEAHDGLGRDPVGALRGLKVKLLEQPREEQEELVQCQGLPNAKPLAQHEGDTALILAELALSRQEAVRPERIRVYPVVLAMHDLPDIGIDRGVRWDEVARHGHRLGGGMRYWNTWKGTVY